jgi:putative membrane protein
MREPRATPTGTSSRTINASRAPKAFGADTFRETPDPDAFTTLAEEPLEVSPEPKRRGRFWKALAWGTGGTLVSLGLGLAAERLISDLFARYDWLGWIGLVALALFVLAIIVLVAREILGLLRLRALDHIRQQAAVAIIVDDLNAAQSVNAQILALYASRADLARPRELLAQDAKAMLDGAELLRLTERSLMAPLDARARALTAASARRVALVTAVSPRALVDIGFVIFESVRLVRNLADLYGARPGVFGFWRLVRAILAHLAVTGGLVLTDGIIEQLIGQGLATKLSARLGEGVVNGLMTVRVGIAAMRVVRPLPFEAVKSPVVSDFAADLVNVSKIPMQGQR